MIQQALFVVLPITLPQKYSEERITVRVTTFKFLARCFFSPTHKYMRPLLNSTIFNSVKMSGCCNSFIISIWKTSCRSVMFKPSPCGPLSSQVFYSTECSFNGAGQKSRLDYGPKSAMKNRGAFRIHCM